MKCENCNSEMVPRVIGFQVERKEEALNEQYIDQAHIWKANSTKDKDSIIHVCKKCSRAC